jgi:hypothetical protein
MIIGIGTPISQSRIPRPIFVSSNYALSPVTRASSIDRGHRAELRHSLRNLVKPDRWLGACLVRGSETCTLLAIVDDATSRLIHLRSLRLNRLSSAPTARRTGSSERSGEWYQKASRKAGSIPRAEITAGPGGRERPARTCARRAASPPDQTPGNKIRRAVE